MKSFRREFMVTSAEEDAICTEVAKKINESLSDRSYDSITTEIARILSMPYDRGSYVTINVPVIIKMDALVDFVTKVRAKDADTRE